MTSPLDDRFFRHEYGRLVAIVARRVGVRNLEAVEDAVQSALLSAVESWPRTSLPDNPSGWLLRVAQNQLVGELRRRARHAVLDERHGNPTPEPLPDAPAVALSGDVRDDLLRMLFVCCDDAIPVESQIALALKTLCGFGVHEIAERLFTTQANVYKRLARARSRLRELELSDDPSPAQLKSRLPAVQAVIYLLFTEGHLSCHPEHTLRRELCDEAVRLGEVLATHPSCAVPETFALLALMHLQRARMSGRRDASGGLLLLEEQDRRQWDRSEMAVGLCWLARSAEGDAFSRYHAEAGIAAEHCLAPSFAETRWQRIVELYALLERLAPSAIHTLNRAVAMAEWRSPAEALAMLEGLAPPSWLTGSHLWAAVLADLHHRVGHAREAERYRQQALETAPTRAIRELLMRRFARNGC